jgi:predicted transcriptional regulator
MGCIRRTGGPSMNKNYRLNPGFFAILYTIYDHQPTTIAEVAQKTGLKPKQVSGTISGHKDLYRQEGHGRWRVATLHELSFDAE